MYAGETKYKLQKRSVPSSSLVVFDICTGKLSRLVNGGANTQPDWITLDDAILGRTAHRDS